MKRASIIWLLTLVLLYGITLYIKFKPISVPDWYSSYAADALCLPVLLSLSLVCLRFIRRTPDLYLTTGMILFIFAYTTLVFEWLLPLYSIRYTADFTDVILYVFGATLFGMAQRRVF